MKFVVSKKKSGLLAVREIRKLLAYKKDKNDLALERMLLETSYFNCGTKKEKADHHQYAAHAIATMRKMVILLKMKTSMLLTLRVRQETRRQPSSNPDVEQK
jgi:hypothetical protein